MGAVRGYGGPTVVILSTVDGPPGPSVAAVHGPGRPSMVADSVRGTDFGGTIGNVTEHGGVSHSQSLIIRFTAHRNAIQFCQMHIQLNATCTT